MNKIVYKNMNLAKIYPRQFGEGVSVLLRQMDFTFAIGEMRRLMCIPEALDSLVCGHPVM